MNDQIKQKLIEDIDNNVAGLTNIQIMQIADIINSQLTADQWIPCSERLPENDGYYETTIDILGCRLNKPICFDTVENRWLANHCVIAWRERLEPYKGE